MDWVVASARTVSLPYTIGLPARGAASHLAFDDGRFHVTHEVARGGMGRILAATDRLLGRRVAIKVALSSEPIVQQRLGREAAILSSLSHDALPPIYELGTLRGGLAYFVTRLVDGETLEQRLKDPAASRDALLAIVADVAEVMHQIHRWGVIHRDLKPSNVLIERDGRVVIVDWGIARRIQPLSFDPGSEALHDLDLTAPGTAIGTPGYWSPEQRRGEPGEPASDVYSLGAIVYRLLAGRASRSGVPTGDELAAALAGAPRWLLDLVARATAIEPGERHASAAAFAAELRRGMAIESRARRERSAPSRFRYLVPAVATAVALVSRDAAPAPAAASRIAAELAARGHWNGDFGEMAFAISGDRVRAVYTHDEGVFIGRIMGNRVVGRWCEAPYATAHDTGDATLVLKGGGADAHVAGHYRYAGDDDWAGRWDLWHGAVATSPELTERLSSATWRCDAIARR
jgi:hypothetical protein